MVAVLLCSLLPIACATSAFDREFEAGQYAAARRIFEADSSLQRHEQSLFRAGLVHAFPGTSAYDPQKARQLFDRLLTLYPESSYGSSVRYLTVFMDEVDRLEKGTALRDEQIKQINNRIEELQERNLWLESLREKLEFQVDTFGGLAVNLEKELRETRFRLRVLREELERLKEIDLKTRRPPG
jgi:hypothetical protein